MTGTPPLPLYRGMDRAALDAAYNNSAAVTGSAETVARWREESAKVRARGDARLDAAYADAERTKLDYFPCGKARAPLFAFIHGGYWQRNDKDGFSVFALGPLARGFDVAMIGYTLAPQARLGRIVDEVSASLEFLSARVDDFGFDPARLYVGGWSAGGHLAAMMLGHSRVRAGLAISGIFDLEPIALTYLDEALSLSESEITNLSPMNLVSPDMAPVRIVAGGDELCELRRQSRDYAATADGAGMKASLRMAEGRNHYTLLEELADPRAGLTRDLVALAESA